MFHCLTWSSYALMLVVLTTNLAVGQLCHRCKMHEACHRGFRLVQEEMKVEITCWGSQCEEFCLPGPSRPCAQHCEQVCENCGTSDDKSVITKPKRFTWIVWSPSGAEVFTRKKLMKRTVTKTVPRYKWVIENLCQDCHADVVTD